MAIVTIARQVAALGDETASALSEKLGYKFIKRTDIEKRIINLGFSESKMPKYDERKPGFFASLAKDRDEYLDYLQYAVLEAASQKNVVIIGRGAFSVLRNVPNNISVRLVADEKVRIERLKAEFNWDDKKAKQRIQESDSNRDGFHKNFFNENVEDSSNYHMVLNTGLLSLEDTVNSIALVVEKIITPEKEKSGEETIEKMFTAQKIVNKLVFDYHIAIEFMHASINENTFTLYGVAESVAVVESALKIVRENLSGYEVVSCVSIVNDFKTYQHQ